jgi:hypothetical protein
VSDLIRWQDNIICCIHGRYRAAKIMAHTIDHLKQREPALLPLAPGCSDHKSYQSLYFVPFKPTPVDLVYTSNTFCPPHESD